MRTTVDLDPELHAEAQRRARESRISLSAIVNEALARSFRPIDPVRIDPLTGLGTITLGHPTTAADVADLLDD